jgi:spoIIIJ-associated protein
MRKEFFGDDLNDALHKASRALGIPVDQLTYQELHEEFGNPRTGLKRAILVDFTEDQVRPSEAVGPDPLAELAAFEQQPDERAARILARILEGLGMPGKVAPQAQGEQVALAVEFRGEPPDLRRGDVRELRASIQYLVNRVQSQGNEGERRYVIDFGGDKEDRSSWIEPLARELAQKVHALQKSLQIGLMDSQDRRVLHLALVEDPLVETVSHGDGRFRVISVQPKG